jgi:hypothetical protein
LVISSAFGLLSARASIPHITTKNGRHISGTTSYRWIDGKDETRAGQPLSDGGGVGPHYFRLIRVSIHAKHDARVQI